MSIPANLKYTKEHEWIRVEGNVGYIGITDFAQSELGEIVFVEVETIGEILEIGQVFGTVEAVKTVSELFIPVGGEVIEFNEELEAAPELINDDPFEKGWIVKINITNPSELDTLLSADDYQALLG